MLFYLFNIWVPILAHKNNGPLNLQREKTVCAKRSTIQAQMYFWCSREIGKYLRIENLRNYKITKRRNMEDDDPLLCFGIHGVWSPGFITFYFSFIENRFFIHYIQITVFPSTTPPRSFPSFLPSTFTPFLSLT